MQTFTKALIDLVLVRRRSTSEVAANASTNRHDFLVSLEHALKRAGTRVMQAAHWQAEGQDEPDPELASSDPVAG